MVASDVETAMKALVRVRAIQVANDRCDSCRGHGYPSHRHAGIEELYMLEGVLIVDGESFQPGDYRRGVAGGVDHRVWSETGCSCVLITSYRDAIL